MSDMDLNTRNKNFSQNQNSGSSQDLKAVSYTHLTLPTILRV